jgi:(1->4)-alpha-D-glucan 1-alpha-D-glucosylmutase
VLAFCGALYSFEPFLADFEPFVDRVAALGDRVSLGMLALKLTVPGVPDIYQGDELAFRVLVDPDNRRPVDWDWHQAMLARLQGGSPPDDPTRKMWLTKLLLQLRIRRPDPFAAGYEPLDAGESAVVFLRGDEILVAVGVRDGVESRSVTGIPPDSWRDVLTGNVLRLGSSVPLSELLGDRGLAVLERAR